MMQLPSIFRDRICHALIFITVFVIVGLTFPFSAPEKFQYNWIPAGMLINRYVYFSVVALALLVVFATREFFGCVDTGVLGWFLYFSAVTFYMFLAGRSNASLSFLYLLFSVAPLALHVYCTPIILSVGAAIAFNTVYGALGMLAATFGADYGFFPIVPYIYDGNIVIGAGFYRAFSAALFFQTNAAGAVFGTAFCFFLYKLINETPRAVPLLLAVVMSLLGLLLTRSLSALLLTTLLCMIVMRGRAMAILLVIIALYGSLILLTPDGVLGLNVAYLQHKIDTSALVKLSLLWQNLRAMAEGGISNFIVPGRQAPAGTENTFIDFSHQFGLVQVLLFYGWCARNLRVLEDRGRALLLFPLILSFVQNSALTTPVFFIFCLALAIYGNKSNRCPRD